MAASFVHEDVLPFQVRDRFPARMRGSLRISIVAPVYDEAPNLERLLERVGSVCGPHPDWELILVDDGMATGATMRAGVQALRDLQPARIVVAVPVSAAETCHLISQDADEVVCGQTPERFRSVGQW